MKSAFLDPLRSENRVFNRFYAILQALLLTKTDFDIIISINLEKVAIQRSRGETDESVTLEHWQPIKKEEDFSHEED